jgi:hypothetical protein
MSESEDAVVLHAVLHTGSYVLRGGIRQAADATARQAGLCQAGAVCLLWWGCFVVGTQHTVEMRTADTGAFVDATPHAAEPGRAEQRWLVPAAHGFTECCCVTWLELLLLLPLLLLLLLLAD